MNKHKFHSKTVVLLLLVLALVTPINGAIVSHSPAQVTPGTFAIGNYSFNGSVGIGKSDPSSQLDVYGTITGGNYDAGDYSRMAGSRLDLYRSSASVVYIGSRTPGNDLYIQTANSSGNLNSHMVVKSDGDVGIGTTNPGYKLEVGGTGRFTGKLYADSFDITGYGNTHFNYGSNHDIYLTYGSTGNLYARTYDGSSYGTSNKVWHAGNDGSGSGLDADTLDGVDSAEASTVSTVVRRNSAGDINVRLLRSEYDSTNSNIGYIMTQIDTASNNYVRPSTPAQVKSALGLSLSCTSKIKSGQSEDGSESCDSGYSRTGCDCYMFGDVTGEHCDAYPSGSSCIVDNCDNPGNCALIVYCCRIT